MSPFLRFTMHTIVMLNQKPCAEVNRLHQSHQRERERENYAEKGGHHNMFLLGNGLAATMMLPPLLPTQATYIQYHELLITTSC